MRILSLVLFLVPFQVHPCAFKSHVQKVFSLSGSLTVTLRELGLLKNGKVKGITVFAPILEEEYPGKVYPGGIFLSPQTLNEFQGSVLFFDESRELSKLLAPRSSVQGIEIRTRGLSPKEASLASLKALAPFLEKCDEKIAGHQERVVDAENRLLKLVKNKTHYLFYLGSLQGNPGPQTVVANDGVVKWLRSRRKLKSYPSDLAYVNWSAKTLNELPKDSVHVGLVDSGREGKREIKKSPRGVTLTYPGVLVPGQTQLEGFIYLFENL
jgi:hypothetical protein